MGTRVDICTCALCLHFGFSTILYYTDERSKTLRRERTFLGPPSEHWGDRPGMQTVLLGAEPRSHLLPLLQAPRPSTCSWACTRTSAATTPALRLLRRSSFLMATTITKALTGEWPSVHCRMEDHHGAGWGGPCGHSRKQLVLVHTQLKFL